MKLSDIVFDLNDFWGRVVPGFVLLANIAILVVGVHSFDPTSIFDPRANCLLNNECPTILVIMLVIFVSYMLGELALWPVFRFKNFCVKRRIRGVVRMGSTVSILRHDVASSEPIESFFRNRFQEEYLERPGARVFKYCKSFLQAHHNDLYLQSKRNEARSNLHGGLILPMLMTTLTMAQMDILLTNGNAFLLSIPAILFVFHYSSFFRRLPEKEHLFVYLSYYWCFKKNEIPTSDGGDKPQSAE